VDRTLYRVLGRRESDHEDLVQATFEQIIKTLAKQRFARACSLKTWASTLAAHVGLNAMRARRRERGVIDRRGSVDETATSGTGNVELEVGIRADIAELRELMTRINPRRAEVVLLRDVLGYEFAEIAVLKGLSVAAAQSLLVRGRRDLARGLERKRLR